MNLEPIYNLRAAEVFKALDTGPEGLTTGEAEARLALYESNVLSEQPKVSHWRRFFTFTAHPMALLLWAAGALAFLVSQPALGMVIWIIILTNAGFTFWREYRAEQAMLALQKLLPTYARLIRGGTETLVPASELVPGDLLVLAEGDNIPADARVVEEYGLRTNNANLTGEAVPARKTADASLREGISELERPNLVFAGTSVVSGTGRAIIYATGMLTQFGRIARLTQAVQEGPSLVQRELARISRIISLVALGIAGIVFVVGIFDVGLARFEAFLLALGILVAAVPEGLPATVTLSLAMAAQRLAQRGVLVKKLAILETLGTVSIVCTDKSGTLTQNQMTAREVWVARQRLIVSGVGYEPVGRFSPDPSGTPLESTLNALLIAAALCNNARLNPPTPDRPQWTCLGDQTEAALRVAALKGEISEDNLAEIFPRIHELPFDARRKRMSTIHMVKDEERADEDGGEIKAEGEGWMDDSLEFSFQPLSVQEVALVKGAPREVLQLCTHILIDAEERALDDGVRAEILAANDDYARNALRVLALARRKLPSRSGGYTTESVERDLTFLGLVAAFQARGEVVAVTGDGVNDAPALRKADVAVAMGMIGTDVAKEAADVILTDDNFGDLVSAVEEGRAIFDNLRKFITYTFASNVPEILPFILTALSDIPLALTVIQILAIDLGTDLLPALALGTEKPEPYVMRNPPRRRAQPLVERRLLARAFLWLGGIEALLCYIGFFYVYHLSGQNEFLLPPVFDLIKIPGLLDGVSEVHLLAITVFHAGVVMAQVGNAFACRTERERGRRLGWLSNRFLLWGILAEIVIILVLIYFPPLARTFNHVPLPPIFWVGLSLYAPVLYSLDWIRKSVVRKLESAKRLYL